MSANKKSVAAQALLEMDTIVSALKEESKKTLGNMLNEAVKDALRESVEDDDDKDYEVIDSEKDDAEDEGNEPENLPAEGGEDVAQVGAEGEAAQAEPEVPADGAQEAPEGEAAGEQPAAAEGEGEEGWDDFSQYQVGDDTYDLTGENDYDSVVKVYKLLKDDDQVVVKKEGNTIQLQDGAAGTEYVIDLGDEGEEAPAAGEESVEGEEAPADGLNEEFEDIAGFPEGDDNDDELSDDEGLDDGLTDDNFSSDNLGGNENNEIFENKNRKPMKESKEVLFEVDLGYTDNYQDKDPIKGLSNNEPSKSGKSWHKGVPTGTEKPWAGSSKDKSDPFGEKTIEEEEGKCCPKCGKCGDECTCEKELEEGATTNSTQPARKKTKQHVANGRKEYLPKVSKSVSTAEGGYEASLAESKELKAIKAENRELKKAVLELRKNLSEAYITNVNLGKITKLFLENTTSKAEKIDIVNRFANEAKTAEQSKALYESIDRELKKGASKQINLNESSQTANGTKELNENKSAAYKSPDVLKTIDFMNRVLNC